MSQERSKAAWTAKNGTLSDKTARKEFGLSEEIIIEAISEIKSKQDHKRYIKRKNFNLVEYYEVTVKIEKPKRHLFERNKENRCNFRINTF